MYNTDIKTSCRILIGKINYTVQINKGNHMKKNDNHYNIM